MLRQTRHLPSTYIPCLLHQLPPFKANKLLWNSAASGPAFSHSSHQECYILLSNLKLCARVYRKPGKETQIFKESVIPRRSRATAWAGGQLTHPLKFVVLAVQGVLQREPEVLASSPSLSTISLRALGPGSSPMDHRFPFPFPRSWLPIYNYTFLVNNFF